MKYLTTILLFYFYGIYTEPLSTDVYGSIEDNFTGGLHSYNRIFKHSLQYPDSILPNDFVGRVFFEIEIDTNENISKINILYSESDSFSKEICQKINLTDGYWLPKYVKEKKVKYKISDNYVFTYDGINK